VERCRAEAQAREAGAVSERPAAVPLGGQEARPSWPQPLCHPLGGGTRAASTRLLECQRWYPGPGGASGCGHGGLWQWEVRVGTRVLREDEQAEARRTTPTRQSGRASRSAPPDAGQDRPRRRGDSRSTRGTIMDHLRQRVWGLPRADPACRCPAAPDRRRGSPRVKHTIVLALRGGRPGQQVCLVCGTTARHCQCWVPPALLPVASASTAKPVVSWWCEVHHEGRTEAAIVTRLTQQQRRKGTHERPTLRRPAPAGL